MPPRRARAVEVQPVVVQKRQEAEVSYEPELVRVRALRRGQYGVRRVVEAQERDADGEVVSTFHVERDARIVNEGETFQMDTHDMRPWPLPAGEHPHGDVADAEIIRTPSGEYELPSWVTATGAEKRTAAVGHTKTFGNLGALTGAKAS